MSLAPDDVAAFLRANPSWLADNPMLYRVLAPPVRVHGEALADHMMAMVQAARDHAAGAAGTAERVLSAGRAAAGLAARVQEAVLALMRANDTGECIATEFPALLGVDAATLCVEASLRWPTARVVPGGTIKLLLAGRAIVVRAAPADAALVHAEAAPLARHDALLSVPVADTPCLLALASREGGWLEGATGALGFLARATAIALGR